LLSDVEKVGLKLHLNPYLLVISGYVSSKYSIDGNTISGAKGSEATTAHGASVPSSGPYGTPRAR
jgi:hypothetical protein